MKKIIISGIVAGAILLVLSILGLYLTAWFFPQLAEQYFAPAFDVPANRYMLYCIHPFIISFALSWFWQRFKGSLKGSFITRGIEFGLIYSAVAILPNMWMIYSAMNVSLEIVGTWLVLGILQGTISGLVFERTNP